jgi:hypothetical protein
MNNLGNFPSSGTSQWHLTVINYRSITFGCCGLVGFCWDHKHNMESSPPLTNILFYKQIKKDFEHGKKPRGSPPYSCTVKCSTKSLV